jgi:serine/threonine protein kinase
MSLHSSSALYLSLQMCMLLKYLREAGLSHNDLKLENIVIMDDFSLALIDFAHCSGYGEVLQTGSLGTQIYRAPEMNYPAHFKKTFKSDLADLFSLGGCLFAFTFFSFPFGGDDQGGATQKNEFYKFFYQKGGDFKFFNKHGINITPANRSVAQVISACFRLIPE